MDNNENTLQRITGFLTGVAGRIILLALVVLICAYGIKASFVFGHDIFFQEPVEAEPGTDKVIRISEDSDLSSIAEQLSEEGLIRNETAFKVQGVLYETNIYPGEFNLNTSMTTKEILAVLNTKPEATAASENAETDVIGGGDEGVSPDQVEAAQREGIDLSADDEIPASEEITDGATSSAADGEQRESDGL